MASDEGPFETSFATSEHQRPSRMDVIPAGRVRRRWTDEAKARIIAASFEPGANIAQIARTHDLLPQQLYAWRHDHIRGRKLAGERLGFAAVIVDEPASMVSTAEGAHEIVIRTDGLAIHVPPQASTEHVARVLAAVRQAG
ncbi:MULTISPECIES: IS66-like element accessory protein TnpA [Sphingomonadales]|uniref:IS66-like element accessory protein TnpA n=1 Tax=Sphingomonadales TaxID=204457 RepID=UPI0018C82626|nr:MULTISPECIES: transposase [Sphingomonadales]